MKNILEQFKWLTNPEDYAEKMVSLIKDRQAQGFSFSQIKNEIANELLPFLGDSQHLRLDNEIKSCSSPCEFIITTYFVLFRPNFSWTRTQNMEGTEILDIVKKLAPDFVGEKELKTFIYKTD